MSSLAIHLMLMSFLFLSCPSLREDNEFLVPVSFAEAGSQAFLSFLICRPSSVPAEGAVG